MRLRFVESNLISSKASNANGRRLELVGILTDGQGNDFFVRWLDNDGSGKVDQGDAFVVIDAKTPKPDGYGTERETPSRDLYRQLHEVKPETDLASFQQRFGSLLKQRTRDTFIEAQQTGLFMEELFTGPYLISRKWEDPQGCWDYEYTFKKENQAYASVRRYNNDSKLFGSNQFPFAQKDNRQYDVMLWRSERGNSSICLRSYHAGGEHGCNHFDTETMKMTVDVDSPDANLFAGAWVFAERTPPPIRPRR